MQPRSTPAVHRRRPSRAVIVRRRITVFAGIPVVLGLAVYGIVAGLSGSTPPPARGGAARHPKPPAARGHPGSPANKTGATTTRPVLVGVRSFTFVDATRTTYNYTSGVTEAGRKLGVEMRYPTDAGSPGQDDPDAPIATRKSYPLIVFAPGYRLRPQDYRALLDAWVGAGFLVASLEFPDTTYPASEAPYRAGLPHGSPEDDLYNEPADVAFALSRLIAQSATAGSWLDGLIDDREIALAGHSDGGSAEAALVYDSAFRVAGLQVHAVAVLSGGELSVSGQGYAQPGDGPVPLLVIQGAADRCTPPSQAVQLYDAIAAPKFFVRLDGASHVGAYSGAEPAPFSVVQKVTVAFFDRSLGITPVTSQQMSAAANDPGVSSITTTVSAAPIPTPPGPASCPAG